MASVQDLFEKCMKKDTSTIVFGNLGRYPHVLRYYLRDFEGILWIEPAFGETVHKPQGMTMIVLTSHLDLTWDDSIVVRAYHLGNVYSDWRSKQLEDTEVRTKTWLYPSHYHKFDENVWRPGDKNDRVCVNLHFLEGISPTFPYLRWLTFLDVWQYVPDLQFISKWNGKYLKNVLKPRLQRSKTNLMQTKLASSNVDCKALLSKRYIIE